MGYKFQFITLAGFHQLNVSMFELARGYEAEMAAYSELQERDSRSRRQRLHRDEAPARGRRRLVRPGPGGLGRHGLDARAQGEPTEEAQFQSGNGSSPRRALA